MDQDSRSCNLVGGVGLSSVLTLSRPGGDQRLKTCLRTECVIDVVQAAAYLDQAVVFLYKAVLRRVQSWKITAGQRLLSQSSGHIRLPQAIDYDGLECPDNSPVGCASSVAGFLTSISCLAVLGGPGKLWFLYTASKYRQQQTVFEQNLVVLV